MKIRQFQFALETFSGDQVGQSRIRWTRNHSTDLFENVITLPGETKRSRALYRAGRLTHFQYDCHQEVAGKSWRQASWLSRDRGRWVLKREKLRQRWRQTLHAPSDLSVHCTGLLFPYFVIPRRLKNRQKVTLPFFHPDRNWFGQAMVERTRSISTPTEWPFVALPGKETVCAQLHFSPLSPWIEEMNRTGWIEWEEDIPRRLAFPQIGLRMQRLDSHPSSQIRVPRKKPSRETLLSTDLPSPYVERRLSFCSSDHTRIAATLETPRREEPKGTVILLHGSGPETRDSGIGLSGRDVVQDPAQRFRDLSRRLNQGGWAVLRFDKRGVGESGGSWVNTGRKELLADAMAAARWAKNNGKGSPIVLLGISEGAALALSVARRIPSISGIIFAGGPANPIDEVFLDKLRMKAKRLKMPPEEVKVFVRRYEEIFRDIRRLARRRPTARVRARFEGLGFRWWSEQMQFIPKNEVRSLRVPVLVIHSRDDLEVLPKEARNMMSALRQAGVPHRLVMLDGLNHIFTRACVDLPGYEYDIPYEFGTLFVRNVLKWLNQEILSGG